MITYIYTLKHPITNEVRYVGKTTSPKRRYKEHIYKLNKTDHKTNWIKSLLRDGLKPVMDIFEECIDNWEEREKYWITQFNNLTNLTDGGGVCSMSDAVKEKIRQANLGKILSEATKDKLRIANIGDKNPYFGIHKKPYTTNPEINQKISNILKQRVKSSNPKRNKLILKPCTINAVEYPSVNNASKVTGIPKGTIHRRLNSKNFPQYIWKSQE